MDNEITLILIAILRSSNVDRVEQRIANGADVNQIYKGKSLLEFAINKGNLEIVKLLVENGAKYNKISVLEQSIANNEDAISNYFISQWGDVKELYNGVYPLVHAITTGNLKLVRILVKNGASLRDINPDIQINLVSVDVLLAFLEAGGNPNTIIDGSPLLTYTINFGEVDFTKILIKYGAKIQLALHDSKLTLDWNNINVTLSYIEAGGDLNKKYDGSSPLEHALKNNNKEMLQILKEHGAKLNKVISKQKEELKIIIDHAPKFDNVTTKSKQIECNYAQEWKIFEYLSIIGLSATVLTTLVKLSNRYSLERNIYDEKRVDLLLEAFKNLLKGKKKGFEVLHDGVQKILIDHADKFPGFTKNLFERTLDIYKSYNSDLKSIGRNSVISKKLKNDLTYNIIEYKPKELIKTNVKVFHVALEEICKKIPEVLEYTAVEKAAMHVVFECPLIALANVVTLIGVGVSLAYDYYSANECN